METLGLGIVGALGVGHIVARYAGRSRVAGVLKPLPIAVLAVMVGQGPALDSRYSTFVMVGLAFSMVGDVCLLAPRGFVAGLASFFVAHLCYIAAFGAGARDEAAGAALLAPFLALGAVLIGVLWRRAKDLRLPVVAYVAVITVMGWQAARRASAPATPEPSGMFAVGGALAFMTSDGLLAFDRFVRPFRTADAAVMATYYAAQTLIGLSTLGPGLTTHHP
jgi:uncharacterized membrane protein YhhN